MFPTINIMLHLYLKILNIYSKTISTYVFKKCSACIRKCYTCIWEIYMFWKSKQWKNQNPKKIDKTCKEKKKERTTRKVLKPVHKTLPKPLQDYSVGPTRFRERRRRDGATNRGNGDGVPARGLSSWRPWPNGPGRRPPCRSRPRHFTQPMTITRKNQKTWRILQDVGSVESHVSSYVAD